VKKLRHSGMFDRRGDMPSRPVWHVQYKQNGAGLFLAPHFKPTVTLIGTFY
jgi:hypothetical protein